MKRFLFFIAVCFSLTLFSFGAIAAPYSAIVADARTREVLHARNADTRLHPAGLTKLMTLYIAFYLIEAGELDLDQEVLVSRNVAAEPPAHLGLYAGAKIQLRYLLRATGVMGANDAATAIAEAIAGDEAKFAKMANKFAEELGLTNTTFKNAHGLTSEGHFSTARDMASLTLALRRDFPEYWNLFSRQTTDAGIKTATHSGIRLLKENDGIEAVKTGYTRAAGFTGVAVATREHKTVVAVVFGGRSQATRNSRMFELLDMGFDRDQSTVESSAPEQDLRECITSTSDARDCAGLIAVTYCGALTETCFESEVVVWESVLQGRFSPAATEASNICILMGGKGSIDEELYCIDHDVGAQHPFNYVKNARIGPDTVCQRHHTVRIDPFIRRKW